MSGGEQTKTTKTPGSWDERVTAVAARKLGLPGWQWKVGRKLDGIGLELEGAVYPVVDGRVDYRQPEPGTLRSIILNAEEAK